MDLKRKHPWLWLRGRTYYLRAKVPVDLVDAIGSEHIKKSLRTTDLKRANSLIQSEAYAIQLQFDALRRSPAHEQTGSLLSSRSIRAIARRWFEAQRETAGFETPSILDKTRRASLVEDQRLELEAITHGEPFEVGRSISEARQLFGADAPDITNDLRAISELADLLIRARRQLILLKLAQLEGDYSDTITDTLFRGAASAPPISTVSPSTDDAREPSNA